MVQCVCLDCSTFSRTSAEQTTESLLSFRRRRPFLAFRFALSSAEIPSLVARNSYLYIAMNKHIKEDRASSVCLPWWSVYTACEK